ncbi:hypothetical protein D3C72_111210 [compost metagenome]
MNRSTFSSLLAATALVTSLAGCVIVDKGSTPIMGYPSSNDPNAVSKRYPWDQITTMEGSTLYDAHHQVKRYLTLHFPDAKLVSVQANQVGANGKIAKSSSWEFTYQTKVRTQPEPTPAPSATPNLQTQAVEIPTQYDVRLLTFTFTGEGQLLAPEADTATLDSGAVIDFDRVLYFNKVIETCLDIGMGMGPAGMQVALRPTTSGGAVYEIDTSVSGREVMARTSGTTTYWYDDYTYDDRYDSKYGTTKPQPTPTPTVSPQYYRGKYVINAYTGDIIQRPTRL